MARLIHQRIGELTASDSVETLIKYSIGRCHALDGNKKGKFALDLVHPYRLIFEKIESETDTIRIKGIEDYH